MIRAVIVDFDDTLCLTEESAFHLENEVLHLMGRPPQTREIHKATWGQMTFDAIKVRSPGIDVEQFRVLSDALLAEWVKHEKIDAIEESRLRILDGLIEQGKQLFILTSRPHQEVRHLIEPDHILASRVTAFYYRDLTNFVKPDPRAFDIVLKDHKFDRKECVYVGDSPSDAMAAKKADMHFVCTLESGVRTKEDFDGLGTDVFISHLDDLPAAVALLDKQLRELA